MKENNNISTSAEGESDKPAGISTDGILHHLRVSIVATIVLAVICCGVYPLVVWGLSQAFFHDKANGSLITDAGGKVVGSRLIGQGFSDAKYFHPRPSAAGSGYDPTASSGSNLGPMSAKLINGTTKPSTPPATQPAVVVDNDGIQLRLLHYCDDNSIPFDAIRDSASADLKPFKTKDGWDEVKLILAFNDGDHPLSIKPGASIPADAVTASASGLDPHISLDNAKIQIARVADARHLKADEVQKLINENTDGAGLGFLGEPGVNVLMLNLALDKVAPVLPSATNPATNPAAH